MIRGLVLDGAAIAEFASGRSIFVRALVEWAIEYDLVLVVPAAALAEAVAHAHPAVHGGFRALLALRGTVIDPLDSRAAVEVAALLSKRYGQALGVATGHVVWSAQSRAWPVLSPEPGPLLDIDPTVRVRLLPRLRDIGPHSMAQVTSPGNKRTRIAEP